MRCAGIRDRLPELVNEALDRGEVDSLLDHLRECEACGSELELVRTLRAERPPVPAGLESAIRASVHRELDRVERGSWWTVPEWALGAAALLALAVGTPLLINRVEREGPVLPQTEPVEAVALTSVWASGDGLLAGAPVFDELSDEALLALLEELNHTEEGA